MLTTVKLASIKPKEKEYTVTDKDGLYLIVKPSGKKFWQFQKMITGKRIKKNLGTYPEMSLKEARETAAQLSAEKTQNVHDTTFQGIYEKWSALKSTQVIHFKDIDQKIKKYLLPVFGPIRMEEMRAPEVIEVLQKLASQGKLETVKRICIYLRQIESFAVNYGLVENMRFQRINDVFPTPKKSNRPSVPPEDLPKVLNKFLSYSGLSSLSWDLVRTGLYTLLRPHEYCQLRWEWIEGDVITVPAEVMKMKREHRLPVSRQLRAILDNRPHQSEYVFPSTFRKGEPYRKDSLPMLFHRCGLSGILVPHGLRSIGRTWMADQRIDFDVAELCLAHSVGTSTVQAYNRADLFEQRIEVMQRWGDFVSECIQKASQMK